jgi:hypothetical protein
LPPDTSATNAAQLARVVLLGRAMVAMWSAKEIVTILLCATKPQNMVIKIGSSWT